MIGGDWNRQNKVLNGAYINFISKKKSSKRNVIPDDSDTDPVGYLLLVDKNGIFFKTADGFRLVVKGG